MNVVVKFPLEKVQRSTSRNLAANHEAEILVFGDFEGPETRNYAEKTALQTKAALKGKNLV